MPPTLHMQLRKGLLNDTLVGGHFFVVANEDSDTIVTFKADANTGKLAPTGDVVHTGSPVCIVFTPAL